MNSIRTTTRRGPFRAEPKSHSNNRQENVMFGNMQLIHEAMSKVRMPKPQDRSEAYRPARQIAMRARRAQSRSYGQ